MRSIVTLLLIVTVASCGDSTTTEPPPVEQEPERPNITGTWDGIEAVDFFPYSWRFTITDDNGVLSGTYKVREDFDWGDASGTITGTHTETGKVTIRLAAGDYHSGVFKGHLSYDKTEMTGQISYEVLEDEGFGPYLLELTK